MVDRIDLEAKDDRELQIMLVMSFNQMVESNDEIVKRLDRGQVRMDQADKRTHKLELWQAGIIEWKRKINGNGVVSQGLSKKTKAAIASAAATLLVVTIDAVVRVLSRGP